MASLLLSIAKKLDTEKFRRFRKMSELNIYLPILSPSALAVMLSQSILRLQYGVSHQTA